MGGHIFRQPFVEIAEQAPVGNLGAVSLQDFVISFDQAMRLVRFHARNGVHRMDRSQLEKQSPERARHAVTAVFRGGN